MTKPCYNCPNLGKPHKGACQKFWDWFNSNEDDPRYDNKKDDNKEEKN